MENKLFESILNEAEITKYMACCYDPEDYYEKTNYIDEDGELSCNSSGAKLFNTEDEAIEYAEDNRPYGWASFAMPFNTTLNESDYIYKAKRLKELTQDEFNRLAKRRDEFRTQTAISPAEKNNLYADIKDFEKEFRNLQDTAERLPDSYIDQVCSTSSYPFDVAIDEVQNVEDWCSEAEDFLKDDINNWGIMKESFFNKLLEVIDDFPKNTRAMYRFAKRRHDDTGAIRKVSKEPYWVHPEGVAKIVMEHGGSDIEIKAAMAHDTMEDAGVSYDDMVEKFGEEVASIVKEVTNDKDEIAKIGKEKYISEELCRLSPEALTVKLADMLYNMKDSPTEKNYERMRKNVAFLMMNRHLDGKHLELAQEIMEI